MHLDQVWAPPRSHSRVILLLRYSQEDIDKKVAKFRKQMLEKIEKEEDRPDFELNEFGKPM